MLEQENKALKVMRDKWELTSGGAAPSLEDLVIMLPRLPSRHTLKGHAKAVTCVRFHQVLYVRVCVLVSLLGMSFVRSFMCRLVTYVAQAYTYIHTRVLTKHWWKCEQLFLSTACKIGFHSVCENLKKNNE